MFQSPEILQRERHSNLKWRDTTCFKHLFGQLSAPLIDEEIHLSSMHFPILFDLGAGGRPVAVFGLTSKNSYLDEQFNWTAPYMPAYVRRYPFVFAEAQNDRDRYHLAIDPSAPHFGAEGEPLFDDQGGTTDVAKNAVAFLAAYQRAAMRTAASHRVLQESGIIRPKNLNFEVNGRAIVVSGYSVVDETAFKALPDNTLAEWARSGLLVTVYAHLYSMRHLHALVAAASRPVTTSSAAS